MKYSPFLLWAGLLAIGAYGSVTEKFSQTYPFTADGSIRLENVNGSVEISIWEKSEAQLEAEKIAPDQASLKRIHLHIEATPNTLSVKTEYEKTWGFWGNTRGEVRYKLSVPPGVTLKGISVVNANISVLGVTGPVDLESVNGHITGRDLAAAAKVSTVNGGIDVQFNKLPPGGKITLSTTNGSCRIAVPPTSSFALSAETTNGETHCTFPITLENSTRRSLRGQVGTGGSTIALHSVNGSFIIESH
jgi:DUF4097 and DUF4098 domain-containing protein YvlB